MTSPPRINFRRKGIVNKLKITNKRVNEPSIDWLSDLDVYAVNRLPAHSDHMYYETMKEASSDFAMKMRHSLNGNWKFNYAVNPQSRVADFYKTVFDSSTWGDITVPGHIQLQDHGKAQYVNTMYPWDGHNDIRPPAIPVDHNPVGSYIKSFVVPANEK